LFAFLFVAQRYDFLSKLKSKQMYLFLIYLFKSIMILFSFSDNSQIITAPFLAAAAAAAAASKTIFLGNLPLHT